MTIVDLNKQTSKDTCKVTMEEAWTYVLYHRYITEDDTTARGILHHMALYGFESEHCWIQNKAVVSDPDMLYKIGQHELKLAIEKENKV